MEPRWKLEGDLEATVLSKAIDTSFEDSGGAVETGEVYEFQVDLGSPRYLPRDWIGIKKGGK